MLSIGLTGNVASGKSAVAAIWAATGLPVLSADQLAREVVEPGTEGLRSVVATFGKDFLTADGSLDRSALRERVFQDDDARRTLEGILHPLIAARRAQWMERQRAEGAEAVAYEIPLLFETGQEGEFDVIAFVDASDETRLNRLVEARGLDREEAARMMAAQLPAARKRDASHVVIDNDGSIDELETAALEALSRIQSEMGPGWPYAPEA